MLFFHPYFFYSILVFGDGRGLPLFEKSGTKNF